MDIWGQATGEGLYNIRRTATDSSIPLQSVSETIICTISVSVQDDIPLQWVATPGNDISVGGVYRRGDTVSATARFSFRGGTPPYRGETGGGGNFTISSSGSARITSTATASDTATIGSGAGRIVGDTYRLTMAIHVDDSEGAGLAYAFTWIFNLEPEQP